MEAALLILILASGDPSSAAAAQSIHEQLALAQPKAQVVVGVDAVKMLTARGLKDAELVEHSERVLAATRDGKLVLVRIERHDAGSNRVVDIDVWASGRRQTASAVTGKDRDPVPAAGEAACRLVRDGAGADRRERYETDLVARFARNADWMGLVEAIAKEPTPSPRLRHAAAMALLRLGDRDGAAAELAKLRNEAPDHPLLRDGLAALSADADAPALR